MNGSNSYHKSIKQANIMDLLRMDKVDYGSETTSNSDKTLFALTFMLKRYSSISDDLLRGYFNGYDGKLVNVFKLLEAVYIAGRRNRTYYRRVLNSNNNHINERIALLLRYGYIKKFVIPSKLMMLNVYTNMDVYGITSRGKGVILGVYESVGLL